MRMKSVAIIGVRCTGSDRALVEAAQQKLGCRSAAEVMRMGLRALGREQGLVASEQQPAENKPEDD